MIRMDCSCRRHSPYLRLQRQKLAHEHSKQAQIYCVAVLDGSITLGSVAEDLHKRLHRDAYSKSLVVTSHKGPSVGDHETRCNAVLT